ncbi:hypothetical protein QCI77_05520 [Bacillus cereus group sp. MG9]|uniref:hypothetical protein n=1 Tax=Bacillus cereus group sp. MG9 TaxID=3040247 RepID=UPI0033944B4A
MVSRINGKLMNQLAIFFSMIIMLQFVADITGLTQNLDSMYYLINTATSYITFSLAVIFTLIGARRELSKYAIILLCSVVGIKAIYFAAIVILWGLAGTP